MYFVEAVVFLSAIVGIILAISSFIFHAITRKVDVGDLDEKVAILVDRAADMALEEFNKTSQIVMDELNEKYKALLFVYQLMDDKQKELDDTKSETKSEEAPVAKPPDSLDSAISTGFGLDIKIDDDLDVQEILLSPSEVVEEDIVEGDFDTFDVAIIEEALAEEVPTEIVLEVPNEDAREVRYEEIPMEVVEFPPVIQHRNAFSHPKYPEIKELLDQGYSVADTARRLGVGTGEIQLIIGLSGR